MRTPLETYLAVGEIGGQLDTTSDGKLRMLLPVACPPELKDAIRAHKPALLRLLQLDFLVVRSDVLKATVFWTRDEATKDAIAQAGIDRGRIYTAAELQNLVTCQTTEAELPLIHEAKVRFNGRLIDR